jgi:protease-4
MTLDADSIAARRRLRRSLSFWRVAAILAAGLAILALVLAVGGDGFKRRTDHVARSARRRPHHRRPAIP